MCRNLVTKYSTWPIYNNHDTRSYLHCIGTNLNTNLNTNPDTYNNTNTRSHISTNTMSNKDCTTWHACRNRT